MRWESTWFPRTVRRGCSTRRQAVGARTCPASAYGPSSGRPWREGMTSRVLGAVAIAVAFGATVSSLAEGTPARLPGVALGSTVLLYAERALALFAFVIAGLSVILQAARGRLPVEFSTSGLCYEAEAADDAAAAVANMQAQLEDLEATTAALAERLDAVARRP